MHKFYESTLTGLGVLILLSGALGQDRRAESSASASTSNHEPALRREVASEAVSVEGLIRLDVVATDEADKPVEGLKRKDFKLIENGLPQKIVAFRASNQAPMGTDVALSVILLLDTVDLPTELQEQERQQAAQFLS